jgi:methylmalonyl-CoA epimerase
MRTEVDVEIDHLGIAVRSLTEGLEFYEQALGITVTLRETVESEGVHVAMLPAGSSPAAPRIELLEAANENSTIARFVESRGPGLHHVALRVDDLMATVERLRSGGYRVLHEPRIGAGGQRYVFVHPHSTGGVLLELIQR